MDAIREDVSVLTLLAEILCLLDMIVNSFAPMISTKPVDRYTRPHFTAQQYLSEASNMVIVMGPNMSGESTYLQQICLIVILAQIGCYIPARFATLRVVDRVFTSMGTVDNLESNSSTYVDCLYSTTMKSSLNLKSMLELKPLLSRKLMLELKADLENEERI